MINSDLYISLMKLNEICEVYSGYAIKEFNNIKKGLPVIKIGNILTDGTLNLGECQFSTEDINEKYHSKKGDIYVALSGATTGKLGIMEDEKKYIINQRVGIIRLKQKSVSQSYIKFFLLKQTERIIDEATGCAQPNISPKQIGEYDVPVFPEKEMLQISDILNNIVCLIKHYKAMIKKYDDLIKARFIEMFGDPVNNDKKWIRDSVERLCKEIYGGGTPSKSHPEYYEGGKIPWITSKDMKKDILIDSQIHINEDGVANSTARIVPKNSVIMVIRSGILKHTLPVAINAVPVTVNQDLKVFVAGNRIVTKFLAYQFKMMERDILSGVRAVTADNIELDALKRRELIVPPIELQQEFADFVEQVDKSREVVKKSLEKTQQLYDSLMQEYFG